MGRKGIYLFLVGLGYDTCTWVVLFSAADLRWVCAQYFVIVSCNKVLEDYDYLLGDNACMYVAHICFKIEVLIAFLCLL